jgi:hypothetical protein
MLVGFYVSAAIFIKALAVPEETRGAVTLSGFDAPVPKSEAEVR